MLRVCSYMLSVLVGKMAGMAWEAIAVVMMNTLRTDAYSEVVTNTHLKLGGVWECRLEYIELGGHGYSLFHPMDHQNKNKIILCGMITTLFGRDHSKVSFSLT